jgi:hypothetical protein
MWSDMAARNRPFSECLYILLDFAMASLGLIPTTGCFYLRLTLYPELYLSIRLFRDLDCTTPTREHLRQKSVGDLSSRLPSPIKTPQN